MSVVLASTLEKTINKKNGGGQTQRSFHCVREAQAGGVVQLYHVQTDKNLADTLTKPLTAKKFHEITEQIMLTR